MALVYFSGWPHFLQESQQIFLHSHCQVTQPGYDIHSSPWFFDGPNRNSEFSHEKWWIFPWRTVNVITRWYSPMCCWMSTRQNCFKSHTPASRCVILCISCDFSCMGSSAHHFVGILLYSMASTTYSMASTTSVATCQWPQWLSNSTMGSN